LLLLLVVLKPVALIVLSFAGNTAAGGLSLGAGIPQSVGTILAAIVIFAFAAFAPWALMYLLAADAESAYAAAGLRSAAGSAVAGKGGRSLRTIGGLRNLGARRWGRAGSGGGGSAGGSSGGGSTGGGSSGGRGGRGRAGGAAEGAWHERRAGGPGGVRNQTVGGARSGASGSTAAATGREEPEWMAQSAVETVGAGSVGAAAGYTPRSPEAHDGAASGGQVGARPSAAGPAGAASTGRPSTPPAERASRLPRELRPSGSDTRMGHADPAPAAAGQGWRRDLPRRSRPSSSRLPSRSSAMWSHCRGRA
jgi:hypothetical protein